jgi:2-keto-4-pentenoate hydratase/2-oxohepta-3-ene-1,7-dioic acid hydratase in catechol pathway
MHLASLDDHSLGVVLGSQAVVLDDVVRAAGWRPGGLSAMRFAIANWPSLEKAVRRAAETKPRVQLSQHTLRTPVPDPSKIVAAPINYLDHQHEMSQTSTVSDLGVFLKAPSSLLDPGGTVQLPYHDRRFDQEGELAVIIATTARNVSADDAPRHVFGYTALLDITMRGGEDRSTRKSFDTFTPVGPWITTADAVPRPDDVDLTCRVSGEVRQRVNTRKLLWGVADLVSYVSSIMTLLPGDIVTTGTPAGVGPLEPDDDIEVTLSGIGSLSVTVASDHPVACPTRGVGKGPIPPPPTRRSSRSTRLGGSRQWVLTAASTSTTTSFLPTGRHTSIAAGTSAGRRYRDGRRTGRSSSSIA